MTNTPMAKVGKFPLPMVVLTLLSTQILYFGPRLIDPWISSSLAGALVGTGIMLSFIPTEKRGIGKWGIVLLVTATTGSVAWYFANQLF